ncbi:biotin--[acetyl-CoA-carboxylase] ligase [Runella sp. MFBS21]|uniref:biotin--[acetyl-CoA-carboxylase] ligase n=1 Tax=Runella sp. MFBS21 TaxID=3034018 RepID=UPI0023F9F134|nr:biotin--[acetyl-CoA-carboxylase] ligase [Runella sp. MFBS21]MDF7821481.1 biotin--[acetyl-CoA-carboxylase] ligase [Runella sp. MFBS21]
MYKIKSKTLFVGKKIVYLPTCQSTNDEAADLLRQGEGIEGTVVITDYQTAGRGQRGNQWLTQAGENFTFSLILRPTFLSPAEQFRLNIAISLGIYDFLEPLVGESLKIKWPNDIYVGNQKLGGVLIENTLQSGRIESAIVGIGLNINQILFESERATSLRVLTSKEYSLAGLLPDLLSCLEKNYLLLRNKHFDTLKTRYLQGLFRYQELHLFQQDEKLFAGMIMGINEMGQLAMQVENKLVYFDLKEISYVF